VTALSVKTFLKLVEIQTKLASLFPFLIGILFVTYRYGTVKPLQTAVFFAAMLIFDMTTTAINNYMDYKKATDNHDFDYRKTRNVIGQENIPEGVAVATILVMLVLASLLGLWLFYLTDIVILLVGVICFGVGVFYTYGPIPLSRLPLGEFFSGVVMGLGITFLTIYVNIFDSNLFSMDFAGEIWIFQLHFTEFLVIMLISLPLVFTIANVMLANNICDVEEDIRNQRFTLPYYIGNSASVRLFYILALGGYLVTVIAVTAGVFHPIMLATLLTAVPVWKNLAVFKRKQVKSETFVIAIKNLILTNGALVIGLIISIII